MINPSELSGATIAELRQFAKERGIALSGATTKGAILERIQQELERMVTSLVPAAPEAAPAAKEPERKAMIISDDGEDAPVRSAPPARPAASASKPGVTSTGKAKPAFNLSGARAWHNPQPFAAQQQPAKYASQLSQQINTLGTPASADPAALRPAPRVSRFGPDAVKEAAPQPAAAPVIPQNYRPSAFAQPGALRPEAAVPAAYAAPVPALEAAPVPGIAAYRRPESMYTAPAEAVRPQPVGGLRARDSQPRDPGGINPAVPEMLATGDCGDGAGVLEIHADGYGFLRAGNYLPGRNDVYISNAQIKRFHLRDGDHVEGKTRPQREGDRYAAMLYITHINGVEAEEQQQRRDFDELTPVYPNRRLALSSAAQNDPVLRFIDLFAPIGFGQRALIVSPPKAGKTTILKKIALSVKAQHPQAHLMMLLVDERPEEVTDLRESVGGDVIYSTFDEPAESHARVSDLVMERAMRLVEDGKDVVILMDSLTRLSRAHNMIAPNSARIMSGGLAAGALHRPKRFFGAARNIKEGGSLTIIATCLVETGSRMDDVIYEEFKGTGNMELTLDRALQEMRLFPAISILKSGTRHEELLLNKDEMTVASRVRQMIAGASEMEGISMILSMIEKTKDNDDFVARFDGWAKMMNR